MIEPSVAGELGRRGGGEVVRCFVCVPVEGSVGSWNLSIGALRDLDQSYWAHACAQLQQHMRSLWRRWHASSLMPGDSQESNCPCPETLSHCVLLYLVMHMVSWVWELLPLSKDVFLPVLPHPWFPY